MKTPAWIRNLDIFFLVISIILLILILFCPLIFILFSPPYNRIFASIILPVILVIFLWILYTHPFGAGFLPTEKKKIPKILEIAEIKKGDIVYDLGCGDARLVIEAAKYCQRAIGIEMDPLRYLISLLRVKISGLKNVQIRYGNFFNQDIRDADVVILFLSQGTNDRLRKKLEKLKRGTRIISHYYKFSGWETKAEDKKLKIYLYII
jgi:SAM-dependent methyltransferase